MTGVSTDDLLRSLSYHVKAKNLSPSTFQQYRVSAERFLRGTATPLQSVTPGDIEAYLAGMFEAFQRHNPLG